MKARATIPPAAVVVALFYFLSFLGLVFYWMKIGKPAAPLTWGCIATVVVAVICLFVRRYFSWVFCSTVLSIFNGWDLDYAFTNVPQTHNLAKLTGYWLAPVIFLTLFLWFTFGKSSRTYFLGTSRDDKVT